MPVPPWEMGIAWPDCARRLENADFFADVQWPLLHVLMINAHYPTSLLLLLLPSHLFGPSPILIPFPTTLFSSTSPPDYEFAEGPWRPVRERERYAN